MKSYALVAVIGTALVMGGCASNNKFACSGMPKGITCKKPSEIYDITSGNSGEAILSGRSGGSGEVGPSRQRRGFDGSEQEVAAREAMIRGRLIEPKTGPMPLREPPRIMRVWVAPYNDENDDLHWPGYVFTEISKRRWAVGEREALGNPVLSPIQVVEPIQRETSVSTSDE